tara:strand:- start:33 stop:590 length:558 start_codon:yes stop_codon:yes gene_type:complete
MLKIPDRVRIVFALAVTVSCGAHQVAVGLSGEPIQRWTYSDTVQQRTTILPEVKPPVETIPSFVSANTYFEVTTTSTLPPAVTLLDLIQEYFEPEDWAWALQVAFCESSAQSYDTTSTARHSSSGASGWFQHLPKFWEERSRKAGIPDGDIMDPRNNVLVAAWLLYETSQGTSHWYPSEHCWGNA